VLHERAGGERREHAGGAPGAVEQPEHRPADVPRQGVGEHVEDAARSGGEHQRDDEHGRIA
jgi:hypothetical protein